MIKRFARRLARHVLHDDLCAARAIAAERDVLRRRIAESQACVGDLRAATQAMINAAIVPVTVNRVRHELDILTLALGSQPPLPPLAYVGPIPLGQTRRVAL